MAAKQEPTVIGVFERVSFPDFGMHDVRAKIDTGAYTGALHCTKIEEIKRPSGKVLKFSPFDNPQKTVTSQQYVVKNVKGSIGKGENRYFITTDIVIAGKLYQILLSLADRSEMKLSVLIGRRFLRNNHFVVDARKRSQYRKPV